MACDSHSCAVKMFQMAVSQKTVVVCPVAAVVREPEYGGGCFLFQLGRIGILSCLHRFFSSRWRDLISRHNTLFLSIISIMVASPHSQGIWRRSKAQHEHAHQPLTLFDTLHIYMGKWGDDMTCSKGLYPTQPTIQRPLFDSLWISFWFGCVCSCFESCCDHLFEKMTFMPRPPPACSRCSR